MDVEYLRSGGGRPWFVGWKHEQDDFADFLVTEAAAMAFHNGPYRNTRDKYTMAETVSALNLVRSYLWRVKHRGLKPLSVSSADDHDQVIDMCQAKGNLHQFTIKMFEEFIRESREITFVEKSIGTLANLYAHWRADGFKALKLPYSFSGTNNSVWFKFIEGIPTNGMAYGCAPEEIPLVFEYLLREGFLNNSGDSYRVSAKGYNELDRLSKGQSVASRSAFLVRRWDTELDKFLRPVMEEVEAKLGCAIEAVWDKDHNERIDERVFRLIRESVVVVVDVTPDRFNVGLELGYALALGKPIVLIREKPLASDPDWKKNLPFDIATLNCYDYERASIGHKELVDKLEARVGLALDDARIRQNNLLPHQSGGGTNSA